MNPGGLLELKGTRSCILGSHPKCTESRLQSYRRSAIARTFVHIAGALAENAEDTAIKMV
jgi:hypothetical protein